MITGAASGISKATAADIQDDAGRYVGAELGPDTEYTYQRGGRIKVHCGMGASLCGVVPLCLHEG